MVVLGNGGTGKSHVIDILSQLLQKTFSRSGDDPDHPYVLRLAFYWQCCTNEIVCSKIDKDNTSESGISELCLIMGGTSPPIISSDWKPSSRIKHRKLMYSNKHFSADIRWCDSFDHFIPNYWKRKYEYAFNKCLPISILSIVQLIFYFSLMAK